MRKDDDGLGRDPHRHAPRKASAGDKAKRYNRLALLLNEVMDELSGLRHDDDIQERYAEPRPSYPLVHYEDPEREP